MEQCRFEASGACLLGQQPAARRDAPSPRRGVCVMYSLAGLDGPGGGQGSAESAASRRPEPSEPEPKRRTAPWSGSATAAMKPLAAMKPRAPAAGARSKPPSQAAGGPSAAAKPGAEFAPATGSGLWFKDIKTPYDPAHPNDYDEWLREAELKAKQAKLDQELQRRIADAEKRPRAAPPPPPPPPPRAAPPPPPPPPRATAPPPPLPQGFSAAGETGDPGVAMMQKMGWSDGQGLGKEGQGMKTPLVAKKRDSATGVITNAEQVRARAKARARARARVRVWVRVWVRGRAPGLGLGVGSGCHRGHHQRGAG